MENLMFCWSLGKQGKREIYLTSSSKMFQGTLWPFSILYELSDYLAPLKTILALLSDFPALSWVHHNLLA